MSDYNYDRDVSVGYSVHSTKYYEDKGKVYDKDKI